MSEAIVHPEHYNSHPSGVEVIDLIRELPYGASSALKYVLRRDLKGKPVEDLEKARFCIEDALSRAVVYRPTDRTKENGARVLTAEPDISVKTIVHSLAVSEEVFTERYLRALTAIEALIDSYGEEGSL